MIFYVRKKSMNVVYWIIICAGHIISLIIIQNGFLATKTVITAKSSCDDVLAGRNCWIEPTYKRAILVVIDALRYDFVNQTSSEDLLFMPKTMEILNSDQNHAHLFKFIADAPTTTMQRVTAMMTGSFPAFIEAGSNFAAVKVDEDNLLYQLKSLGRHSLFFGDDTWAQLFPNAFNESVYMESFNVKDLDTVDDAVKPFLFNATKKRNTSLLIAHFLGVDHCGHRYGPDHPEMIRKLNEMDDVVSRLVNSLDKDTVLFVFGDHGMTKSGDHGGDSYLETTAGLFIYSPKGFYGEYTDIVRQIDLVPTLALLLDIPIPFSSLGMVMRNLFEPTIIPKIISINVKQVVRYVSNYMRGNVEVEKAAKKTIMYHEQTGGSASEPADFEVIQELRDIVIHSMNRFDSDLVWTGAISLTESIILNLSICFSDGGSHLVPIVIFHSALMFLRLSTYFQNKDAEVLLKPALYASIVYRLVVLTTIIYYSKHEIGVRLQRIIVPITLFIIYSALPFSNSYILYGPECARFITSSILIYMVYIRSRLNKKMTIKLWPILIMLTSLRIGPLSYECREELPECTDGFFSKPLNRLPDESARVKRLFYGGMVMIFFAIRLKKSEDNTVSLIHAALRVMLLITFFNWLCEFQPDERMKIYGLYSAQIFLIIYLFTSMCTIVFAPPKFCGSLLMDLLIVLLSILGGDSVLIQLLAAREFLMYFQEFLIIRDAVMPASVLTIFSWILFYNTGHSPVFSAIPFRAAFVFVSGEVLLRVFQGLFVIVHLYCGHLITGIYVAFQRNHSTDVSFYLLLSAIQTGLSCLATVYHRKHLMMYKVFAPNFLFTAVGFIVTICVVFLCRYIISPLNKQKY